MNKEATRRHDHVDELYRDVSLYLDYVKSKNLDMIKNRINSKSMKGNPASKISEVESIDDKLLRAIDSLKEIKLLETLATIKKIEDHIDAFASRVYDEKSDTISIDDEILDGLNKGYIIKCIYDDAAYIDHDCATCNDRNLCFGETELDNSCHDENCECNRNCPFTNEFNPEFCNNNKYSKSCGDIREDECDLEEELDEFCDALESFISGYMESHTFEKNDPSEYVDIEISEDNDHMHIIKITTKKL